MKTLALSALLIAAVTPLYAQTIPDGSIDAAIKAGYTTKESGSAVVTGIRTRFTLLIDGPLSRIQGEAAKAAKAYKPFTRADVPDALLEPAVTVTAVPEEPAHYNGRWHVTPNATHLVLKPKGSDEAIQPINVETFAVSFGNAFGASASGQGVVATFRMSDLPAGDFEAVVVTEDQEQKLTVKGKDRAKIR